MSKSRKSFWIVTLLFVLGGCSSYRAVSLPGVATDPVTHDGQTVQEGDWVKISLVDDDDVVGTVIFVSPRELVVAPGGTDEVASGRPEHSADNATVIPVTRIRAVEVRESNVGASVLVMALLVGSVVAMTTVDIDMDLSDWDVEGGY